MLTIEDYKWIMDKVRNIEAADNALDDEGVQINRRRIETHLQDHFDPDVHVHLHLKDCNADAGQLAFAVSPREENVGRHRVNIVRVTLTDIDPPPPPPPLVNVTLKYDSAFVRGLFHSNAPEPTTV